MAMQSTIQPYGQVKNRPLSAVDPTAMQQGDALLVQVESQTLNKKRQQDAQTAGMSRSMMGPMTLSLFGTGSFFT